jgi:hypothetical protein
MNTAAAVLTALSLASAATVASAATQASDTDYVRADRCRGLAVGLGLDASALNAFVKQQSAGRSPLVSDRADEEFAKAKREAHGDAKDRLTAEFNSSCTAFMGASKAVATR